MDYSQRKQRVLLLSLLAMASSSYAVTYYDKSATASQASEQAQQDGLRYLQAIDRDEVNPVPVIVGNPVKSNMQPSYRVRQADQGFYTLLMAGFDGADLRVSEGSSVRSYGAGAGALSLTGAYKHHAHEKFFYGGEFSLLASSFLSETKDEDVATNRVKVSAYGGASLGAMIGTELPSFDQVQLGIGLSMRRIHFDPVESAANFLGPKSQKVRYGFNAHLDYDAPLGALWFLRHSLGYHYYPQYSENISNFESNGASVTMGYTFTSLTGMIGLGYNMFENKAAKYYYSSIKPAGFYVGGLLGADQLVTTMTTKSDSSTTFSSASLNQSELISVLGGYTYGLGQRWESMRRWFASGELELSVSSPGRSVNDMNSARTLESMGVAAVVGYELINNNQYYLKLGSGYTHVSTARTRVGTGDNKLMLGYAVKKRKTPVNAALGYQAMLSKNLALKSEAGFAYLGTEKQDGQSVEYDFSQFSAKIGAVYYFKK